MITIRKATATDCPRIKELEESCGLCSWTLADYRAETVRADSCFIAACEGEKVVGFLLARLQPSAFSDDEREFELYNIATHAAHRRQKVGSLLLGELPASVPISLEVRSSNTSAISFYSRHGFRVSGRRPRFYSNPPDDAIIMRRGRGHP